MPDNRLTLTIEARNLASQAFKQFQTDVRQSNEALQKTGQAGAQSSSGIKVFRDELGRFHNVATGRYISAAQVIQQGFQVIEKGATQANQRGLMPFERGTESFAKGVDAAAASLSGGFADAFLGVPKAARPANEALVRMRREFEFLRNDIHNTAAVSRQFAGALQRQGRAQFDAAASLERLQVSLVTISGSTAAATQQYNRLLEAARLPGINLQNSLRASLQLQAIGKSGQESKTIIEEFGNAFALAGGSGQQLGGVVHGIRQIISDGKVLQRELNIITSRIAILTPIMQEAFGGNRAEDVRAFAESIGRGNDTVGVFFEAILKGLKELPRAGNTAANAIENLGDSYERAQASIGGNFLPIVKEATAVLEGVFKVVERSPGLARSIAIFEALGGTFLAVTAAAAGFAAALPAVAAGLAFLATNPIGLTIVAVAALTAGLVALKVASQDVETQVERLATTFDELDTALRKNHEAIQSNQQAQVESAKSSLTAQRTAIEQHITLLEEERASIERSIEANRKRAEQGLLPIASTGESFGTQLDNANARLEVTQHRLQEVNDALRANEEASVPIQKATVNIETLTKAVTRLKAELEEETTFEGISQSVTGDPAGFRSSAQALADIETLLRVNVDRFKELREAAASGNQEAATALSKLNQQFEGLRDTQADRHVDNLAAAFEKLTKTTDPSRKQLEAILKSADAFVQIFQGGADVLQDDVSRALGLISQVREQLQGLTADELRLEAHDEGAQALTEALLRFYDLQSTVQEDAGVDAQRSAEKQATAYIRAYQDSIDPAVLNVVESVKLLREEVRGTIQDLERVQAQDTLKLDVRGEIGGDQRDALAELFDLNQAVQGNITQNQIENYRKRVDALAQTLADETLNLQAHIPEVEALQERLRDARLSLLEGEIQERDALYEDDLKAQSQVEEAKRQGNEKTYDYNVFLLALRRKSIEEATQEFVRLEERALDASSQRQRENLIRETQQFADAYAQRGNAFRDLVADAQELGGELQEAFDLTEQTRRLEDFRDGVADVINDLASVAVDHIFDSFTDSTRNAADAVADFRDGIRLLKNDILRLERGEEDADIRKQRLLEDRDRRIAQLRREQQTLAARQPTGDQAVLERSAQRQQDLSFRISQVRENFGVRLSRFDEDTDRRRSRTIEDATQRRERFESRDSDEGLISKLGDSLASSVSNAVSSALAGGLAGLISGALENPFNTLIEGIKGLFGGGGDSSGDAGGTTDSEQQEADADVTGTINALKLSDPAPTAPTINVTGTINALALSDPAPTINVDVTGVIKSAVQAVAEAYTVPSVDVMGRITKAELSEGAELPAVPGLKGGIDRVVLQMNASLPIVAGLTGEIDSLSIKETLEDLPSAPALEARIDALTIATEATAGLSANIAGVINALTLEGTLPAVTGLTGTISDLIISPEIDTPSVEGLHGIIATAATNLATTPEVDITGRITSLALQATAPTLEGLNVAIEGVTLNPDIDTPTVTGLDARIDSAALDPTIDLPTITGLAGRIDSLTLAPDIDLPTIRIPATVVVGPVTGGQRQRGNDEEDPENPMLNTGGLEGAISSLIIDPAALADIQPVELNGVINATLNKLFDEPIILTGRIDATVNYLTGAGGGGGNQGGGGGGDGGGGDEDPVQRSQVAEDLSTIANVLQNAAVSGNLDPSLGPTPRVDVPTPNLDIDNQPPPGATHPEGFGDTLGNANQFAPRAGGGGRAEVSGALRVTFPTEVLSKLAQEETLSKQFLSVNHHLATIRTFIANGADWATETTLAGIAETLNQIQFATEKTADSPLVQRLVDAGIAFPNDPQDPTNAAFTQSPIQDILGRGGLSLFAGFDAINSNLETLRNLQGLAEPTPDLSQMPGGSEGTPMYAHIVNQPQVQDVRLVGGVLDGVKDTLKTKVEGTVDVKQVGVVQVSQSGEWVIQLASGQTIPVYVQGGSVQANLSQGGISTLAELIDVENQRRDAFNTAI